MRKFTITIEAKTEGDADSALSWIRNAIENGYVMAPWNSDGEGSGYSFSSEGDFDDASGDDVAGTGATHSCPACGWEGTESELDPHSFAGGFSGECPRCESDLETIGEVNLPARRTSNSRRHTNRPKAENMLLDRIVAKICKPIIAKTAPKR